MKKIMFNDAYGLTDAVLQGRKTMTRRIAKIQRPSPDWEIAFPVFENESKYDSYEDMQLNCPLFGAYCWVDGKGNYTEWVKPVYRVGEVISVAQSYKNCGLFDLYEAQKETAGCNNKMFVKANLMPHQIKITNVSIEQLQDISDEDCLREGIYKDECKTYFNGYAFELTRCKGNCILAKQWYKSPKEAFAALINKISGKGPWESNPFVWVYEFELIK